MSDWELILTMVGEKATTDITVASDVKNIRAEARDVFLSMLRNRLLTPS